MVLYSPEVSNNSYFSLLGDDQRALRIGRKLNLRKGDLSSDDKGTYHKGTLTITRFDLNAGIISGTFDFVLAKPGCDTIKVTQGRFDRKL